MTEPHRAAHGRAPKVAVACLLIAPGLAGILILVIGAIT